MDRVERTALISILINVGLVFLKVGLAALSGSIALLADAWHSGSDVAASGLVWAGARISRRDGRRHLAVVENIVGVVIALLIFYAAFGIFRRVSTLATASVTNLPIAIGGSLFAALVSYFAAQYKLFVGRETESVSLMADGYHSRMDTLTTGAVVVGLMGQAIGVRLDPIAAAVVAIFVVESGIVILLSAVGGLRMGTIAQSTPVVAIAHSAPVRAIGAGLEAIGLAAFGRYLGRAAREPGKRWRLVVTIGGIVVAVWCLSGIYFIGPGRVGVVTRWGRALPESVEPGAHLKAPWPVDRVTRVELRKPRRVEVGFRTRENPREVSEVAAEFYATLWESRHAAGTYEKVPEEALRLTGDENIVDLNAVVFYRVADARAFLYSVASTDDLVRYATESVITHIVGRLPLEEVLTMRRSSLEEEVATEVQRFLDREGAGVRIVSTRLQDMHPPLEVVPSFRDISSAREDKNKTINEAHAYANQLVPRARGEAEKLIREAEAYRLERVEKAKGDADRIIAMAEAYRNGRDVTRTRLYLETMEEILAGIEKFFVSEDVELRGYDIRVFDKGLANEATISE
ncbi:MAG: FtsH protease activity modulator HflK [Candidatus Eisenbacteria bacterium]|nr:FtsH protease activity modulator HflK [Candidatus Eisenbacteria bacterium]